MIIPLTSWNKMEVISLQMQLSLFDTMAIPQSTPCETSKQDGGNLRIETEAIPSLQLQSSLFDTPEQDRGNPTSAIAIISIQNSGTRWRQSHDPAISISYKTIQRRSPVQL